MSHVKQFFPVGLEPLVPLTGGRHCLLSAHRSARGTLTIKGLTLPNAITSGISVTRAAW